MKCMKAIKAALLAAVMIFQLSAAAYAEAAVSIDNWTISYTGENADAVDKTKNYAELSNRYYFEGETSAAVSYPSFAEGCGLELSNTLSQQMQEGAYSLSFYIRGNMAPPYTYAGIGENLFTLEPANWTVTNETGADGNVWKKYEKTIEYLPGGGSELTFRFEGYTNGCLIDGVSLVLEGGSLNLVNNPGFEDVSQSMESDYNSAEYDPVNVITSAFSGGLAISWVNPSTSNLKSIELYRIENGGETLVEKNFSNVPGDIVTHKITGLVNGNIYQYKLRFNFRDGAVVEYFTFGSPSGDEYRATGWGTVRSVGDLGYAPVSYSVDTNESYEGEASFKYTSNIKNTISNVFGMITKSLPALEIGADYRLSFFVKAENNKSTMQLSNQWANLPGNKSQVIDGAQGTYDWKEFTVDITDNTETNIVLQFVFTSSAEGLWFDNFTLYKMENQEPVGENLISNGGFEEDAAPAPAPVKGLKAEGGDETVSLSWSEPAGADRVRVYELTKNDGYCPRGYVAAGVNAASFFGLYNDKEYSFGVSPVGKSLEESEMETVSVMTKAPDFKIYAPEITKGGAVVSELEHGTYVITTKVKNNGIEQPVPVVQIAALYRGGVLAGISSQSEMIEMAEPGELPVSLKSTLNIPVENSEEYHIEIFIWDSKAGMKSLYSSVRID